MNIGVYDYFVRSPLGQAFLGGHHNKSMLGGRQFGHGGLCGDVHMSKCALQGVSPNRRKNHKPPPQHHENAVPVSSGNTTDIIGTS